MSVDRDSAVNRQLRTLFDFGSTSGLTDRELLERFATRPPESAEGAFATLVARHGPMVLRVCRGVLAEPQDVQDAFQATFLVLIRKARTLWVQDSLGPWLHEVAYRTAACVRAETIRRRRTEGRAAELRVEAVLPQGQGTDDGLVRALHEEIVRLPDRYRVPLVLFYLEGLTQEEVARQLRWPVGTVKSRMARGRERLKSRLNRRDRVEALSFLGASRDSIPDGWARSTVRTALDFSANRVVTGTVPGSCVLLAEGVLRTMTLMKLRAIIAASLAFGTLAAGFAAWAKTPPATGEPPAKNAKDSTKPEKAPDVAAKVDVDPKTKKDMDRIQGTWKVSEVQIGDKGFTGGEKWQLITFEGDRMTMTFDGKRAEKSSTFILDATELPRTIRVKGDVMGFDGIYEFDGRHLRICYNQKKRPTKFDGQQVKEAPFNVLFELDREATTTVPSPESPPSR